MVPCMGVGSHYGCCQMSHRAGHNHPRRKQGIIRLFEEQNGKCAYCGTDMTLKLGERNTVTKDHVVPRSKGGPTEAWNLVASCATCNCRKSDRPLVVWLAIITDGKPETHPLYRMTSRCNSDARSRSVA